MFPRLVIDLDKLRHNAEALCTLARERGISDLAFVTKVFCADWEMVRVLTETPCRFLADSRIENLMQPEFRAGHPARPQRRRQAAGPDPQGGSDD